LEGNEASGSARKGRRPAYFAEAGGFVSTAVFDRARLRNGEMVHGPALIEETESTVVVGPAARVVVDGTGNLIMTIAPQE
jgi:N-methylhydantoinase A